MKNSIFILVLLLNGIRLNAQTKPSKQETIDWLTAKIRENSTYSTNTSTCTYTVTEDHKIKISSSNNIGIFKISFSFDDICDARINRLGGKTIYVKLKSPSIGYYDDGSSGEYNQYLLFFEPDIAERMLKSFKTLAEYNCPPAKNTF
ncbi:hypothetical protein [Pedobacter sp.]|uniref:hypothetical protein n=1 Tax=Pedobacter sp. TaxID=1411316 RepID=UPI0031DECDD4